MSFVHSVFFTCKPGTTPADIDGQIADAQSLLGKIPSVRLIRSGRRETSMQRDVNVTDYDIGLVVLFDDKAGHDLYAEHALHLQYVGKYKEHWQQVRVFDYSA
jgi:hypothetical protein